MRNNQTVLYLGLLLTIMTACNNSTETIKNSFDSVSTPHDTPIIRQIISEDKFVGLYMSNTIDSGETQPELDLSYDRNFSLVTNLCEGLGPIKGTYNLNDSNLKFVVTEQGFKGFCGDTQKVFFMTITSDSELIYRGVQIGCYPRTNDIFRKRP